MSYMSVLQVIFLFWVCVREQGLVDGKAAGYIGASGLGVGGGWG